MKKETIESEWVRYIQGYYLPGEYGNYKGNQKFDRYDIELFAGDIILDCYPNNGTFITRCCKVIEGHYVKNIRMRPRSPIRDLPSGPRQNKAKEQTVIAIKAERAVVVLRCGPCGHEEHISLEKFKNRRTDCDNCLRLGYISTMDLKGVITKK